MANVKSVTQREKGALIHLEDGSKPIWTPEYESAVRLIGKPIPDDWTQKEGPLGPQALPPRKGGGGMSAWRNTKEGFEAETRGRQRWQEIEEEKRDRRTALMQAVAMNKIGTDAIHNANIFYAWLRSSPARGDQEVTKTAPERRQAAPEPSQTSPAGRSHEPAAVVTAGDSSSPSSGEASAASVEPGVDNSGEGVPLGSTRFPVKPEDCSHKFGTTGNWLKPTQIAGQPVCPRCGLATVIYREG